MSGGRTPIPQGERLSAALARVDQALREMWRGDPLPYMEAWDHSADVTLMGGLGPVEKGWDAVSDTLSWVGAKFGDGGPARIEHLAAVEGADLAYTVGYEHRTASLDGGQVHERSLRVTHIYRRSPDGNWHIVHRHADYAQPDPRHIT